MADDTNQTIAAIKLTVTLENGEVVHQTNGVEEIQLGAGQNLPALETQIERMETGERKQFTVEPTDAFGSHDENLVSTLPRSRLAPEVEPEIGMRLSGVSEDGTKVSLRIVEVKPEEIVVDANHPLAGQSLHFDAELVELKAA